MMAGVYETRGEFNQAIAQYNEVLKLDQSCSRAHLRLGAIYIKENNLTNAIKALDLAVKYDPEALEPRYLLVLVYSLQKKYDLVNQEYEKFLRLASQADPANVYLYKELGTVYLQQGNLEAAEKTYKLLIAAEPKNSQAHLMLGTIYEKQGKKDTAIAEFKAAIDSNPDDHLALNALGYLYAEEGINLSEAEILVRKALEFEPNNGAYLDSLGWVHFKKEMLDMAIEELGRAVTMMDDPVIYEHLGDAYLKKGDRKKAKDNWQQALRLNPEQKSIQEKIEKLNLLP